MRERLDHQSAAHDVGKREPALQPAVRRRPDDAADGDRCRDQPETDGTHAEALARVQHEHGPGRPVGDVEGDDREGERAHRWVRDQPADAFRHLGPQAAAFHRALGGKVSDVRRDARHQHRPERETGGVGGERQRHPDGEQEGADRRPHELVAEQEGARQACVGDPEIDPRDDPRHEAAAGNVGEDLGCPEDEQRQQHDRDADRAADDRRGEHRKDHRSSEVDSGDDAAPIEAVSDGAGREAEQQSSGAAGPAPQMTRAVGHCVNEAMSSGPAANAIPSPKLEVTERGQQPAEAAAKSTGRDGFGDAGREEGHRAEDSNALAARSSSRRAPMDLADRSRGARTPDDVPRRRGSPRRSSGDRCRTSRRSSGRSRERA